MGAIDLNCDLGESYGNWSVGDDEAMLSVISSANVACGFHGGDPATLRRACTSATERHVVIGAQVSYPDLLGFGRRFIDIDPGDLRDAVLYQLGALDAFAQVAGAEVAYIKPHGALYHACIERPEHAHAVIQAAAEYDFSLAVLGAPGSVLLELAEDAGLEPVAEAFTDRAYLPDGRLVPRRQTGAVLTDVDAIVRRALRLAAEGKVEAVDGSTVTVRARSLCVHGDTPGAVSIARAVRAAFDGAGIGVHAFAA